MNSTALAQRPNRARKKSDVLWRLCISWPNTDNRGASSPITQTRFFSASSQIGKFTDFIVICHISTLFLNISSESRLDHVASYICKRLYCQWRIKKKEFGVKL